MWSNVVVEGNAPSGRCKHAVALAGSDLYLYGGKSGPMGLRDFWKLELHAGKWAEIRAKNPPPALQGHSLICYNGNLYLFGGQIGIADSETPLWIYNIKENFWRKWQGKSMAPLGRRDHTASIYSGYMLIHGGYRDLKGSQGDIWAFHFETESWNLFYRHSPPAWFDQFPESRHNHSGLVHGGYFYIYGGMCDLEEKSDFWKFDLGCRRWAQIKAKPHPGKLKCASVSKAQGFMFLFGGERDGKLVDEFWRFSFDRENWEKICFYGSKPSPRQLPAVVMLPAIIRIRNVPVDSSYWWDNMSPVPEVKPRTNVNVVLKKLGGHYQMVGSQTADECGEGDEQQLLDPANQFLQVPTPSPSPCPPSYSNRDHGGHGPRCRNHSDNNEPSVDRKCYYSTSDYSSMETISDGRDRIFEPSSSRHDLKFRAENFNEGEAIEMESFGEIDARYEVTTPNYLLVIGGYDAQGKHFGKVPMPIWRLRVSHEIFV